MEIRPSIPDDVPAMAALERLAFSDPMPEDMIARLLSREDCIVLTASRGVELLGWTACQYVLDEGNVLTISVRPETRRQGIGNALLQRAITDARARRMSFLTLEVRETNLPARALYEKNGFQVVGRRKNYYEKPVEDAILMTAFFGKEDDHPC